MFIAAAFVIGPPWSHRTEAHTLRAHEVDNMWIVDSSPFPSSAAVNPALTVAALALRIADSGQLTS